MIRSRLSGSISGPEVGALKPICMSADLRYHIVAEAADIVDRGGQSRTEQAKVEGGDARVLQGLDVAHPVDRAAGEQLPLTVHGALRLRLGIGRHAVGEADGGGIA